MSVRFEGSEARGVVRIEGDVRISCALEVKTVLLQVLASGHDICVNLVEVANLDVTILQLLLATERDAKKQGRGFRFDGPVPEHVLSIAADLGIELFHGTDPSR